ncbi:Oidioi.mRNA.OKI2018_I69.chr1.g1365.t1.cds [Oikopleura dioica]|uniref:Oidioi.mRNA.OKI2018_I69.chr1.g1365.t1.cds n=1 Tax=Oikopleura dioica TaxID=34765 RepID=A0ABN7SU10_OIKDI|nr:Oidioi.mRNA.OKI2018_I69.chr1.g1365.t1.cds [Oikopleura dioica]
MKLLWTLLLSSRADEDCAPNEKICERVENAPEKVDEICGSDGVTYANQCVFKHYKCVTGVVVHKVANGACEGESKHLDSINISQLEQKHLCPVQCNKTRGSKVCATDGQTYNNECAIFQKQCEGEEVFFEHFGSCCDGEDCSGYEGEGMLMDSVVEEEIEAEEPSAKAAAYAGIARADTECLRGCTLNLLPVCGTDGNSYPNSCVLTERKCSDSPDLQILHHGFCHRTIHNDDYDEYMEAKDPDWNKDQPDYDSPLFQVNDDHVITVNVEYEDEFDSDQLFLFDAALEGGDYEEEEEEIETTTMLQTTQASTTPAPTQNPKCIDAYPKFVDGKFQKCPSSKEHYEPVCGSDDVTYFNECHFLSALCFEPKKKKIEIEHDGVCESDPFHAFHEALESKRRPQIGNGLDRSGGNRSKMEKAKARREKRIQHRINRKKAKGKQSLINARSQVVSTQEENQDEIKAEKQLSRYEKRVAWRKAKRAKNNPKKNNSSAVSGMLMDVGMAGGDEASETMHELDEKFPDLCSEINCDDFAEPSSSICGRVKNMEDQELTGKIWSFRSRCFFKRKRCHLIKKSQQVFAAQVRKQKNSIEKNGIDPSEVKKIKFNKTGSRLKRVDCESGELLKKNQADEIAEDFEESSEYEAEN